MQVDDVSCPKCHAAQFQIIDEKRGLLACVYCRNNWIDERFVVKTETEKFLEEQAKQPKVIIDNTTDTDRAMMGFMSALGGLFTNPLRGCLYSLRRTLITVVVTAIVLVALAIIVYTYFIAPNV